MSKLLYACAQELIDSIPQIMQSIRIEMRRGRGPDISIPQFRTLRTIQCCPNTSLSDLAEHLGLTSPSVSKLVDGLVKQELVVRQESTTDRRQLTLLLTPAGESIVNSAHASARARFARYLSRLSDDELKTICQAMKLLRPIFTLCGIEN